VNSGDDAEEGEAGGGRREGGSLPNGGVGSAGGGGGGSRLRTVVLPLLLRASFSHRCVSFLFSSLSNSASLCFSVLLLLSAGGGGNDWDCGRWLGNQVAAAVMVVLRRFFFSVLCSSLCLSLFFCFFFNFSRCRCCYRWLGGRWELAVALVVALLCCSSFYAKISAPMSSLLFFFFLFSFSIRFRFFPLCNCSSPLLFPLLFLFLLFCPSFSDLKNKLPHLFSVLPLPFFLLPSLYL